MYTPRLSVIVPTHNRRQLLAALSRQTYPLQDIEVIVVVDGATDGTWEMVQELRTPYVLRAIYRGRGGPAGARNCGALLARGPLLLFLDDDLLPQPGLLGEHMRFHLDDPNAVVLGRFLPDLEARKEGWNIWEERIFQRHYEHMEVGRRPPAGRRLYSGNFSVARRHFLKVGGFDEQLQRNEDVDLGLRLEREGLRFHFSPGAAAVHRGFRGFSSWCRAAYLNGRADIHCALQKGQAAVMAQMINSYSRKPYLLRRLVEACIGRPGLGALTVRTLRAGAGVLNTAGAGALAHYGYSAIFRLYYCQGIADELGGREAFLDYLTGWKARHWLQSDGNSEALAAGAGPVERELSSVTGRPHEGR